MPKKHPYYNTECGIRKQMSENVKEKDRRTVEMGRDIKYTEKYR